ncbi:MAG: DUF1269 domain-containing protein [Anaerolineae bacterium]|nr:DUF1269 domain-containing protein [Anaerolineae bacterium]
MGDALIDVVVAAFDDELAAFTAMDHLKRLRGEGRIALKDMAIVQRDEDNRLRIKETNDPGAVRGAVVGGAIGGMIGLLLGPLAIPAAAAGAALGALTEKLHDAGIADDKLQRLGEGLKAGTTAVVAVTTADSSAEVQRVLLESGARVIAEGLNEYTYEKLAAASGDAPTESDAPDTA